MLRDREQLRSLLAQFLFDVSMVVVNAALRVPNHAWRRGFLRHGARVDLGSDTSISRGLRLTCRGNLSIGDRTIINPGALLDARGGLSIGADVNMSPDVKIWTADHDPASHTFGGRTRAVVVGSRSWLASGAVLLPGTVVGPGCVVAAGAIVHGALEPFTIVAGNPARTVGRRPLDAQQRLSPHRRFFG